MRSIQIPDLACVLVAMNGAIRPPVVQVAFVTSAPRIILAGGGDPVGDAEIEPYVRVKALPKEVADMVLKALKGETNARSVGDKETSAG